MKIFQKFKPEQPLLIILQANMVRLVNNTEVMLEEDVLLSKIRHELKSEFDVFLNNRRIQEIYHEPDFKFVNPSG